MMNQEFCVVCGFRRGNHEINCQYYLPPTMFQVNIKKEKVMPTPEKDTLKNQILFLTKVYKKLQKMGASTTKLNESFVDLMEDLNRDNQIDADAIEIVYELLGIDIKKPKTSSTKPATTPDPCSRGYSGGTRGGC
jgi:hypothetical protein